MFGICSIKSKHTFNGADLGRAERSRQVMTGASRDNLSVFPIWVILIPDLPVSGLQQPRVSQFSHISDHTTTFNSLSTMLKFIEFLNSCGYDAWLYVKFKKNRQIFWWREREPGSTHGEAPPPATICSHSGSLACKLDFIRLSHRFS